MRAVVGDEKYKPASALELTNRLVHTVYLATDNSSAASCERAATLAAECGARHQCVHVQRVVDAALDALGDEQRPRYRRAYLKWSIFEFLCALTTCSAHGGSASENLALQNVQARTRMVMSYLLAQTAPHSGTGLLVLATGNVDESLRGSLRIWHRFTTNLQFSTFEIQAISPNMIARRAI